MDKASLLIKSFLAFRGGSGFAAHSPYTFFVVLLMCWNNDAFAEREIWGFEQMVYKDSSPQKALKTGKPFSAFLLSKNGRN
jgi:hypothetical protein